MRFALLTGLFAFAAPAAAQNSQPPSVNPPAAAPQPPAAQPRTASPAEVGQLVQAEFPARDRDGNGSLSQAEFAGWVGELMARAPGQATPPSAGAREAQAAAAFTQADTDRNQAISPAEMTALLSRTH